MTRLVPVLLGCVLFAGCGSDAASTSSTETTAATPTQTTPAETGVSPAGPPPPPAESNDDAKRFEVSASGGTVEGGPGRWKVSQGDKVVITITSDVADEAHLHGYDVKRDLEPATPTELEVTADIAGVYELELEEAALPLGQLEVSP